MADADDFDLGAEGVAGTDGQGPAHLFDACADHAASYGDRLHAEAHDDGGGQPAGGGETLEEGVFARGFVEMKGLRVVLAAEFLDLFGGDSGLAERVELLAYVKVFEIKLLWHVFSCFGYEFTGCWEAVSLSRCPEVTPICTENTDLRTNKNKSNDKIQGPSLRSG